MIRPRRRSTRLLAAVAALAALTLGACGVGTAPAIRVGDTGIDQASIVDELDATMARREFFLQAYGFCVTNGTDLSSQAQQGFDVSGSCPTEETEGVADLSSGNVPQGTVTLVVRQRIYYTQIANELEKRGVAPSKADYTEIDGQLQSQIATGQTFLQILDTGDTKADEAYVSDLRDGFARQAAFVNLFDTQEELEEFSRRASKDVWVHSRYGEWDPTLGVLEPLTGPLPDPAAPPAGPGF